MRERSGWTCIHVKLYVRLSLNVLIMSDSGDVLKELRRKVETILSVTDRYRDDNDSLKSEAEQLNSRLESQESQIEELKEKNNSISLAEAFSTSSGDNQEAKLKVSKIVREIDKCIALLNK